MLRTISPSVIRGTIQAPASKSAMQRACALALLHQGETLILNPGSSKDDIAALGIITALGARVEKTRPGEWVVHSNGFMDDIHPENTGEISVHCGESGLSVRMFTPIAALVSLPVKLAGKGSLLTRPMDFFEHVLPQLGVTVLSHHGKLPLLIKGPLQPADICIDASLSSQFLTGLLMAFARSAKQRIVITVTGLNSKPYIDLTLQMMTHFGYQVTNDQYRQFIIEPVRTTKQRILYAVEGDWSSASFLLVAGAIGKGIILTGLDLFSTQADKAILQVFSQAGVQLAGTENELILTPPHNGLQAFRFNATDCPDLFPPLVALAAYCSGTSVISGVSRLLHKESNRALSLKQEFEKMGIAVTIQDDQMHITGGKLRGTGVDAHHDHRIAMACAVAALGAEGPVTITGADAVEKSYPGFYDDLKLLGADVSLPINT